jgi:putative flippase GtrA
MTVLTSNEPDVRKEGVLCLKHIGVSVIGLGVDALLLHLGMEAGLRAAWARVGSLLVAMQVTFVLNGLHVFKRLDRDALPRQWLAYMAANGVGNFANYWIFVTLVSLHWRVVSDHFVALGVGAVFAWVINYGTARLVVFRKSARLSGGPAPGGPGSARR